MQVVACSGGKRDGDEGWVVEHDMVHSILNHNIHRIVPNTPSSTPVISRLIEFMYMVSVSVCDLAIEDKG